MAQSTASTALMTAFSQKQDVPRISKSSSSINRAKTNKHCAQTGKAAKSTDLAQPMQLL
jgi:hypothetical protein